MVMKREEKTVKGYFQTPEREGASRPLKTHGFYVIIVFSNDFCFLMMLLLNKKPVLAIIL